MQIDMENYHRESHQFIAKASTNGVKKIKILKSSKYQQPIITTTKNTLAKLNFDRMLSDVADAIDHKQHSDLSHGLPAD